MSVVTGPGASVGFQMPLGPGTRGAEGPGPPLLGRPLSVPWSHPALGCDQQRQLPGWPPCVLPVSSPRTVQQAPALVGCSGPLPPLAQLSGRQTH